MSEVGEMSRVGEIGLRERKRRATQHAIERGALALALEHGYENVTVEMICDIAMISQRTFFNYAGSKERAVLGIDPPLPDDVLRHAFITGQGGSPLQDLIAMMSTILSCAVGSAAGLFAQRREVLQANPALALKEFNRMEETHLAIVDLVRERLHADEPGREPSQFDDEAHMVVSIAFGMARYVTRDRPSDELPSSPSDVLDGATKLARKVITD